MTLLSPGAPDALMAAAAVRPGASRIFIVDDDPVTTMVLHGVLEDAGFCVESAGTAGEAFRIILRTIPDLILMDVQLPDGDGYELCDRLRHEATAAQIPVLFISANEDLSSKIKGFEAGGVDYITKPIAAQEVLARVGTHLRLKRSFDTLAELQAERIQRLAQAQETVMPLPGDWPAAKFEFYLKQSLRAGGDFYDVIQAGNGVVDYIVADASGHDLAASFWTVALKTLLGEYATADNSPLTVIRSINGALNRILPPGVFFTAIYARLNRSTGKLVLVNAGHPCAVVVPRDHGKVAIVRQDGDVIGAFSDVTFGVTEVQLQVGDRFFLFSDGLVETGGTVEQGLGRLVRACDRHGRSPLAEMVRSIVPEVTLNLTASDDVLLLGVEV